MSGNSSAADDLQVLCKPCHSKLTMSHFRRITESSNPEEWAKWKWLAKRASVKKPMLLCDFDDWEDISKVLLQKRQDVMNGQESLF